MPSSSKLHLVNSSGKIVVRFFVCSPLIIHGLGRKVREQSHPAYSGIGIASLGILRPDMVVKSIVPVVMAGILGIYGLIVSVILIQKSNNFLIISG